MAKIKKTSKFEFTGPNQILHFTLYIYLKKYYKTSLRLKDQCLS